MNRISVSIGELVSSKAKIEWDDDGHSAICKIDYDDSLEKKSLANLSRLLDKQFNIREKNYVINAGMLSMLFDSKKRPCQFDIYTNPARWGKCTSPVVEAIPATLHIDAPFDEDGHSEGVDAPEEFYEPERGTLYLSWGEVSIWYAIAPALALGVANDGTLAQIRLDGLNVQMADQEAAGLWRKLRHRLGF